MLRQILSSLGALVLLLGAVGCTETRTYSVALKNETPRPVTIALTKDGGPFEQAWASPEELMDRHNPPGHYGIRVIGPGKTASVSNVSGKFQKGSQAWLRVYDGALSNFNMALTQPGRYRIDVPLQPGVNHFVVRDTEEAFTVVTAQP